MASQDPNGISSKENPNDQRWNYTALLSYNGRRNFTLSTKQKIP